MSIRFACALALLALAAVPPTRAATFVVDSTGDGGDALPGDGACETFTPGECTLRAAIEEGNAATEATRIELPEGTFPGVHSISQRMHVIGEGPARTIIDGQGGGPVLRLDGQAQLVLADLTVTNGFSWTEAGGIHAGDRLDAGMMSLSNVHVSHCMGWVGGIATAAALSMTDVVIEHCTSRSLAGGLRTHYTTASLTRCRFSDNVGSAMRVLGGRATVLSCSFVRNRTLQEGGAISSFGAGITIASTTMTDNEARSGGALFLERGNASLTNCTITGNIAELEAGGIRGMGSNGGFNVRNTTIVLNGAARGGGLVVGEAMHLHDVILFGNDADEGPDCLGPINGTDNLVGDTSGCTTNPGVVLTREDPLLGPLADNGGPTLTHALLPGSPAIDAGTSLALLADQRGVPRPSGEANDLGAYELDQTADADRDGTPDFLDDCVDVANESQLDADADGWGDECDCAPSDAGSHAVPGEITLSVTHAGSVVLEWTDLSGLVGAGLQHDIASDAIDSLREGGVADAPCLEREWVGTSWLDTDAPAEGSVYYLVRAVNVCGPPAGEGWGRDSSSRARPACP